MQTTEAARLINKEMEDHGLTRAGLNWKWDNAKRRFGSAKFRRANGVIIPAGLSFSRDLFSRNDEVTCHDVILHEIAHIKAGHKAGHGPRWKAVCRQIGANPARIYEADEVESAPSKWIGTCSLDCDNHTGVWKRDRLTKRARNGLCPSCHEGINWRQNR